MLLSKNVVERPPPRAQYPRTIETCARNALVDLEIDNYANPRREFVSIAPVQIESQEYVAFLRISQFGERTNFQILDSKFVDSNVSKKFLLFFKSLPSNGSGEKRRSFANEQF